MGLIMLIYHPHHDIYHCIHRIISILSIIENNHLEFSKLRIIDFYFVFPHLVSEIAFPRMKGIAGLKNKSKELNKPYEILPEKRRLFSELGDFQIQAIHILKAKKIIFEDNIGCVHIDEEFYNNNIQTLISNSKYTSDKYFIDLVTILSGIQMLGVKGLKKRTGLMEYRYDAV